MVRAHLKQTVSFCDSQICKTPFQPHPDYHRTIVAGFALVPFPPPLRFISSAGRQEEGDGEEESRDRLMALQDQRV